MKGYAFGITDALRLAVFVVLAALLFVLQLDKASENQGRFAALVSPGMGGFADVQIAQGTLQSNPEEAGKRLEALVRNRPMEAAHLSLFGMWAVERDDPRASPALTAAAKRGWRDQYTQLTVLGSAVANGQIDVAVARLDALGRLKLDQDAYSIALDALLGSEEGRRAVAVRMVESDYLFARLLHDARVQKPVRPETVSTVAAALALDQDMSCAKLGAMVTPILWGGDVEGVRKVWPKRCQAKNDTDLAFNFDEADADEYPLAWKIERAPGLSIRPGQSRGAVTVINRDPIRRRFAQRFIMLPSGQYELTVVTPQLSATTPGFRTASLMLEANCVEAPGVPRARVFKTEGKGAFAFDVPQDCAILDLQAMVSRGKAENVSLLLTRLAE